MKYYVHTLTDNQGDHEVHTEYCQYLPSLVNRVYLGEFTYCSQAVAEARRRGYTPANGCYWCASACHTS